MPGTPKVLVVDDDPVIVRLLEVNFEMEGFRVISAVDGLDGIEKARAELPDIIVSDVMMPKLNGLELCVAIKADETTTAIPVVLLSAKAQVADIRAGLDAGADEKRRGALRIDGPAHKRAVVGGEIGDVLVA